jgi:hypothetical protein
MASAAYHGKVNDFCDRLRQRRVEGSLAAAKGTAELLRQLLTSSRLADPHSMLEEVRSVGVKIQSAKPIGARARQGDEGTALPDPRRRSAPAAAACPPPTFFMHSPRAAWASRARRDAPVLPPRRPQSW